MGIFPFSVTKLVNGVEGLWHNLVEMKMRKDFQPSSTSDVIDFASWQQRKQAPQQ